MLGWKRGLAVEIGDSPMYAQTIRTLFEVGTIGGQTDGQLLERFAACRNEAGEAAFAALVSRHGSMVLCVCRSVLGDAHDAEDAFQATFLVLAKRAGSIRDPELLGNWLYGVARRTAKKAKARRARSYGRAEREASMSLIAGEAGLAELGPIQVEDNAALHEEVDRLPHRLRVPIVLCYMEGLTHAEAARRLRWPVGTVRSRMARARGVLKSRLARRGLAYAGFFIASETSRAAMAEVPQALAARTARSAMVAAGAAGGLVSSPVGTLVADVLKGMVASKIKRTAAALVAAACLAAGVQLIASGATQAEAGSRRADGAAKLAVDEVGKERGRGQQAAQSERQAERKMKLAGVVLDPEGKPVSGAPVAVLGFPRRGRAGWDHSGTDSVLGQQLADLAGRFQMSLPRTSSEQFFSIDVVSGTSGFGVGWQPVDPDAESAEIEIRLPPERVVQGRLVDVRGEPAAGIAVSVAHLAVQRDGEFSGIGIREPVAGLLPWPATVKTDERGRFLIRGVGRDVKLGVHIRDERFARQEISIEPQALEVTDGKAYVLTPAHPIDGRVTYADTKASVAHARMVAQGGHYLSDLADAKGRFRLNPYADVVYRSMTTGESLFTVYAYAPEGQPYLGVSKEITWKKGSVRQTVDFALPRGVLVRGKITEKHSGKPIEGARIQYEPLKQPEFDSSYGVLTGEWSAVVSYADGTFAIPVPEGAGHLVVIQASPEFILSEYGSQTLAGHAGGRRKYAQALVRIEAPKGNDPVDVAISLRRGVTLTGEVVGPDGTPVVDGAIITRFNVSAQAGRWGGYRVPISNGRFVLPGLEPDRTYTLLVHDAKARWGATVEVSPKADANVPVSIRLAPCGAVRIELLDPAGKPVSGYRAGLQVVLTPGRFQCEFDGNMRGEDLAADAGPAPGYPGYQGGPPTSAGGSVTFSGLIPGATYRLLTTENGNISIDSSVLKDFKAASGQTLELSRLRIDRSASEK